MSIAFSCAACDAALTVRDELAGRRLRCTNCGSSNTVPELDDPETSEGTGEATFARTNSGVAAFYRFLIVGCILIVALTGITATLLVAGSAPIAPLDEVLVGGVKTTAGVLRRNDRLKEPRKLIGKVHKVTFKKGQSYVIDHESTEFDAYLILVDANGRILAEDDDGGGNLNARIIYRPLEDGDFRIIATSLNNQQIGNYRLTIREDDGKAALVQPQFAKQPVQPAPFFPPQALPQQQLPTIPKTLVEGKLEMSDTLRPADTFAHPHNPRAIGKAYEIELRGDRSYSIDMKSNSVDARTKQRFDSYLIVVDAAMNVLAEDDDSGGNLNSHVDFMPPARGKYRIICTSLPKNQMGQFELIIVEMPRVAGVLPGQAPVFQPPATPVELADGKFEIRDRIIITDKLAKVGKVGLNHGKVYEMQMTEGVTYRIDLELDTPGKNAGRSARINVQSVADNPAVTQSTSTMTKTAEMSFTPIATGRYRIAATSTAGIYIGSFTLRVTEDKK